MKTETISAAPLVFEPYLKPVIWGGTSLCSYKGLPACTDKIGESWEISAVPGHESIVAEGEYKGEKLTDLCSRFGSSLLGKKVEERYHGAFPLLVKLIDANDNLSVQVHPDDALAMKRHNSLGKTEMWYIIDTRPGACIFAGLKDKMTPDDYVRRVADDTFADALAVHESHPGDVFFLPAGRVHAIGAGNLLAEIQESSDVTYRIYDYNRRDAQGNTRELHTELAKDAIDYTVYPSYKEAPADPAKADAEVVKCNHFDVRRVLLDGEMELHFSPESFTVVMCLHGACTISYTAADGSEAAVSLAEGHSALLPAILHDIRVKGSATLLTAQA